MLIEINDILVNTSNICTVKRYNALSTDKTELIIAFVNGKSEVINFKTIEDLQVAYQTLKLCETVVKLKKI